MVRARRAALAAFVLLWSAAALALAAAPPPAISPGSGPLLPAVAWPPSAGLLVSEVVTGGTSASDEYIELTNAGSSPIDLNGFEVAYASSAGTSATRRAGWASPTTLGPGRHVLIANSAGIYAPGADATYTAGIAATGGAIVVRPVGGTPIDAVGWGDATNAFVEGTPVEAPPAGSSIERRPGGPAGNVTDTNQNTSDWQVNSAPNPENLGAPARPLPGPSSSPSARPTPSPTPSATPSATPIPTPIPTASPSPSPKPTTSLSPTPVPSPTPTAIPTPTPTPVPTPSPTATATPSPTATANPGSITISQAIRQGGKVTVEAVATTSTTLLDPSGRLLVIQDATAAIEVRLPVAGSPGAAGLAGHVPGPGTGLRITGTVGRAYGAPRLSASLVTWLGAASSPLPVRLSVAATAALEWRLVQVNGRLVTVHKLGDRWRAEIIVGKVRIPVAGLAGSRISVGRLLAGRLVTIIGIVRRAYPSAIDQRFAIEPRSISDVAFEPAGPSHPAPAGGAGGAGSGPPDAGYGPGVAPVSSSATLPSATGGQALVDLRDLPAHRGEQVQVGGLVTALLGSAITIDDGTASGRLVLAGEAAAYLDLVEIGDPIRVEGLVEVDAGGPYLLVSDPEGVVATGDPTAATTASPGSPLTAAGAAADPPSSDAPSGGPPTGLAVSRDSGTQPSVLIALTGLAVGLTLGLVLLIVRRGRRAAPLPAVSGSNRPAPDAGGEPG